MVIFIITGLLILLSIIYIHFKNKFSFWENYGIPSLPTTFPLGNLNEVGKSLHWIYRIQEIYESFKNKSKVAGFYFMVSPRLIVTNLDFLKYVLIKDFNFFRNRGVYFKEEIDPLAGHLFNIENEKWKILRTKLAPTFTSLKLRGMFTFIDTKHRELVDYIDKYVEQKSAIDIKDVCVRYTADVIALSAFGLECNCLTQTNSEFMEEANRVFDFTSARRKLQFFIQNTFKTLAAKLNSRTIMIETEKYFMGIIENTVKYRENNPANYDDFFNSLWNIHKHGIVKVQNGEEKVGRITYNEMAAQAFVFFFAGFETSSTSLHFTLYELAKNQDIQQKAREEAKSIIEKYGGKLTYEGCNEAIYIGQIINGMCYLILVEYSFLKYCF